MSSVCSFPSFVLTFLDFQFSFKILQDDITAPDMTGGSKAHFDGMFAEQDYEKAAQFFQVAADQGNSCAQGFLGYMYTTGQGVLENRHTAVNYYRAASEKGHVVAQFDLGVCYSQGRGVPKDPAEQMVPDISDLL